MPPRLKQGRIPSSVNKDNPLGLPLHVRERRELDNLAAHVRQLYIQARKSRFPNASKPVAGKNMDRDEFWWKAAKFSMDHDIRADELVNLTFRTVKSPLPVDLYRKDVQDRIRRKKSDCKEWAEQDAKLMTQMLRRKMEVQGMSAREVVEEADNYFNPLFLYTVAFQAGFQDLTEKLEPNALQFLEEHEDYRRALERWLPSYLRI